MSPQGSSSAPDATFNVGFKRYLSAKVVPGDAVYVFSEDNTTALRSPHLQSLVPLLDGSRDLTALRQEIPAGTPHEQVAGLLADLADAGLVTLHPPPEPGTDAAALAFWDACGVDADKAVRTAGRVGLITVGTGSGAAAEALRTAGLTISNGESDLSVVLCDDYLADGLAEIDAAHRANGQPWLLAKPTGARIWVGPVFTPGDGPCWQCMAVRLWGHRPAEAHVRDSLGLRGAIPRPATTIAPLTAIAHNLVALEAAKWCAGHRYPGQQQVWILDGRDLDGTHHEVRARPQCPACGDPELMRQQAKQPVVVHSRPKAHTTGGGHRAMPPDQILAAYRHLISPVTGVVKEVRRDPNGPAFLNAFRSGPNVALGTRGAGQLRSALRYENGGKGVTPLDAEVGALCEALERHSAFLHGDEERVPSTFHSLGDAAIHPGTCLLFHPRQYAVRDRWNAEHSLFQFVPEPFDNDAVLDWTPIWSLTRRQHRFLPTGMLYFGGPAGPVIADSNGNAAGSTIEDAILQGMLEVIERDAIAIWWYNRTSQPGVDLDSFTDPWISELHAIYADLAREVWVLDVTSDIGVPTMAAISRCTGGPRETIMLGFGAHLDPSVALRRALTELNQMLPAVINMGPGDEASGDDPDAQRWWAHATIENQPYLRPDPTQPLRTPADYRYTYCRDLADDIRTVRTRLEAAGREVLVLDQTRPDIALPVVKVVVPGMRGFWARLGPGRLYDIPVQLGRLRTPTGYDDLNLMPLFL